MLFKQIQQHGDNFSYIIADEITREAVVVDPSYNTSEIIHVLKTEHLTLKYIINTHGHSDHTAGNNELIALFNAKIVAHKLSRISAQMQVDDGDIIYV
ncbi:MAG: MBL fold metallo-hydrolase, partial [Candidatus Bathyarchaeia archaeon]